VDLVSQIDPANGATLIHSDIKKAVFEMRKVLGEIPILASEQVSS
jgi:hypothetical protein